MGFDDETTIGTNDLAALLLVEPRRIQQLAKDGWLAKKGKNEYFLKSSIQGYVKFLKQNKEARQLTAEGLTNKDLIAEDYRYKKAKADQMELEIGKQRGELHTTQDILKGVGTILKNVQKALRGIPSKVGLRYSTMTKPELIAQDLQSQLDEALEEASEIEAQLKAD